MNQQLLKTAFAEGFMDQMRSAARPSSFGADPAFMLNALGRAAGFASANGHNVARGTTRNVHALKLIREQQKMGVPSVRKT